LGQPVQQDYHLDIQNDKAAFLVSNIRLPLPS
jgi:hypothetical protein